MIDRLFSLLSRRLFKAGDGPQTEGDLLRERLAAKTTEAKTVLDKNWQEHLSLLRARLGEVNLSRIVQKMGDYDDRNFSLGLVWTFKSNGSSNSFSAGQEDFVQIENSPEFLHLKREAKQRGFYVQMQSGHHRHFITAVGVSLDPFQGRDLFSNYHYTDMLRYAIDPRKRDLASVLAPV
jgi:hypothetical protein